MEITRVPLIPKAATRSPEIAQGRAGGARAAETGAKQVAQKQALDQALTQAILQQSKVPAADFSKVRVRLDIDSESGRLMAAIENKQTGELVQTIPSETILRGAAMLERVIGMVLDTPA